MKRTVALTCLGALALIAISPTAADARWRRHGWTGIDRVYVGRSWRYLYPHRHHWYSYDFGSAPWRYRGRDDNAWAEE